jgi:hypothetical protein
MLNQNFIIFRMKVSNIGTDPIKDFFIGMHDDPDTPEQGSQEWTDDFAQFFPVGSDVPGYSDEEDALLWNTGIVWDGDDQVQGLIASKVPWVGLKVLETPEDPANPGTELGLTTLDVFEYSQAPQNEVAEYEQISGQYHVMNPSDTYGVQSPNNIAAASDDWTQTPNTFGPDITYVFASGPFQFNPGETLTFALASIHAFNKNALLGNAMYLQTLWEGNLVSAEAPPQPIVRAIPGDKKVSLYWGDQSETGVYADGHVNDQLTRTNMFEGYRVYKSTDRGFTWGTPITDMYGTFKGYIPLAQYDINNLISGESEDRPFFDLGTNSGLKHYYIDQNVSNGFEYWYSVTAYDRAEGIIFPLENSIKTNADWSDEDNTVAVTPFRPPTGSESSTITNAVHTAGTSDLAEFVTTLIDNSAITGHTYTVGVDTAGGSTSFTVRDGSTIVKDVAGNDIFRRELYDSALDNAPIFDGIHLVVTDISAGISSNTGTNALYDTDDGYYVDNTYTSREIFHDYEWEFTADTDLYPAVSYWQIQYPSYGEPDVMIPIKITDLTTGQIIVPIWRDGNDGNDEWNGNYNLSFDKWESLYLQEGMYYDPADVLTAADFSSVAGSKFQVIRGDNATVGVVAVGDKVNIVTYKPLTVADTYTITTTASSTAGITAKSLEDIQAVPNPFIVSSRFETGAYMFQKLLQFHQLPEKCTLRIYNMASDFIQEIEHNGGSIESWNLQNYNGQEVSFGVYFLHVDAPGIGEHIAKFAIIK